jgi:hypothetical protein
VKPNAIRLTRVIRLFGASVGPLPWMRNESIETDRSDNVTDAVTTVYVRRKDGTVVVVRAASRAIDVYEFGEVKPPLRRSSPCARP